MLFIKRQDQRLETKQIQKKKIFLTSEDGFFFQLAQCNEANIVHTKIIDCRKAHKAPPRFKKKTINMAKIHWSGLD